MCSSDLAVEYPLVPTALTAATRNTYEVPFVRPVTVNEVEVDPVAAATVHVLPASEETWYEYPVMALPPFDAGAVQLSATVVLPRVPVTVVGAPGVVAGVTDGVEEENVPVPTAFTAATLNKYAVPFVRPVNV